MRPVERGAAPTWPNGTPHLFRGYADARSWLIASLGEYCSFCEVPLGVSLAVEHMVAKAGVPDETSWGNLLLACNNCNIRKGTKVGSEGDLARYYWPNAVPAGAAGSTFDLLSYVRAVRTPQSLVDDGLLTLPDARARLPYVTQGFDLVWVTPRGGLSPAVTTKVKQTITLTGLNDYVPPAANEKVSDRRITARTKAWDNATATAAHLARYLNPYVGPYAAAATDPARAAVLAAARDDVAVRLLVEQARALAVANGFWSTWLTVLLDPALPLGLPAFRTWFVCRILVTSFPGTRLPFAGIAACP